MKKMPLWSIPLALLLLYCGMRALRREGDFEIFYEAGRRMLDGEPLYRLSDGGLPLKTSPFFSLFMIPFSLFPLQIAKGIWFLLSSGLLLWGMKRLGAS